VCLEVSGCTVAPTVGRSVTEADVGPVSASNSCFELRYEGPSKLLSRPLLPDGVPPDLEVHVLDSVNAAFREIAQTWPIRCSSRDPMSVEIVSIQHDQVRDREGHVPHVKTCVEVQSPLGSAAECAATDVPPIESGDAGKGSLADAYEGEFRRSLRIATETAVRRLVQMPRASD
jgi:hypothetical protein